MTFEPKSISDQIQCLAQLTGAPETFVFQVQELFTRKGISLESDAAPYLRALEEAFQREESIRTRAQRTQVSIRKLRSNADNGNKTYSKQIEQLSAFKKISARKLESYAQERVARRSRSKEITDRL